MALQGAADLTPNSSPWHGCQQEQPHAVLAGRMVPPLGPVVPPERCRCQSPAPSSLKHFWAARTLQYPLEDCSVPAPSLSETYRVIYTARQEFGAAG